MLQKTFIEKKISYMRANLAMEKVNHQENLISGLKDGNRTAQEQFYKTYFPTMFPIAYRFSSNKEEAHEIINNAFLNVIRTIKNYSKDNFNGWVSTIVRRAAIDYFRKYKNDKLPISELMEFDEKSYNDALSNLHMEDVLKLIQKLPPSTRTVFNLYVFDGLKHEEIAKTLSISKGTSKWHVSNGRKILTELFKALNLEV